MRITEHKTTPEGFKLLYLGTKIDPETALQKQIVHDLYTDNKDLEKKLHAFSSEMAPKANNRAILSQNKEIAHFKMF